MKRFDVSKEVVARLSESGRETLYGVATKLRAVENATRMVSHVSLQTEQTPLLLSLRRQHAGSTKPGILLWRGSLVFGMRGWPGLVYWYIPGQLT